MILIDSVVPGFDSYVLPGGFPNVGTPAIGRSWTFQEVLRSMQWRAGGVIKNRLAFTEHQSPELLRELLEESATVANNRRPSSYSSLFHSLYRTPRVSGPVSRAVATMEVVGGWQELTLPPKDYPGTWNRYDIQSAYLWAVSQGLPDTRTFRYSERLGGKRGVYFADILPAIHAPPPYRFGGRMTVTPEEIERYSLTPERIHYGITWTQERGADAMLNAALKWSCWKSVGRSFWGRWASRGIVGCRTYTTAGTLSKAWSLPNNAFNPIWAHLITGRIRARVYEVCRSVPTARVYVDSVLINGTLPTGASIGDWRHESKYTGLALRHINAYNSLAS